jgi:hypothetical protein
MVVRCHPPAPFVAAHQRPASDVGALTLRAACLCVTVDLFSMSPDVRIVAGEALRGSDVARANRIERCRCAVLYQSTNHSTQARARSKSANAPVGYSDRYFSIWNNDSKYGLSLLTNGRLNEKMTPRSTGRGAASPLHRTATVRGQGESGI